MMGTKKQKTNVSNAIVATLYSMDPPGRFLKQCAETGKWNELSKTDAANRVAQAMAYAVRGKEQIKWRREQLRRSRSSLLQKQKDDTEGKKSPQRADRPTRPKNCTTNNHLGGDIILSSAAQGLATLRIGVAAGASIGNPSAFEQLSMPGNSHIQQQHLRQHPQQSSTTSTTLPASLGSYVDQHVSQNGLVQLLLKSQQHPPQYMAQNPLEQLLQSQTFLQPALQIEELMPTLSRAHQQQQLLIQQLLNQQNVLTTSLPPSISLSAPLMTGAGNRSQLHISYPLQPLQQQFNPLNDFLLSRMLDNLQQQPNYSITRTSNAPQQAQNENQFLRSLMPQQNQLLASTLDASSLNNILSPQQQLDCLLQQTMGTLPSQQFQNSQILPPPSINFGVLASSANLAAQSSDQERTEDEVQIGSEEDSAGD